MNVGTGLLALAVIIGVTSNVVAHPLFYVGNNDDPLPTDYTSCALGDFDVYVGSVCFRAGHIAPDFFGEASVNINDFVISPASGFLCQDLDNDHFCGEPDEGEIGFTFCGSATIGFFNGWVPQAPLNVLLDGFVFGSVLISPCGNLISTAFSGTVSHS